MTQQQKYLIHQKYVSGLRCNISGLGNAACYRVGVNRWSIGNHPSFMLYRLARSPLTQRDWKVKDRFGLVRSANSAQAQSLLLCPALCPVMGGITKKSAGKGGRHSKKIVPPLLKCGWNATSVWSFWWRWTVRPYLKTVIRPTYLLTYLVAWSTILKTFLVHTTQIDRTW